MREQAPLSELLSQSFDGAWGPADPTGTPILRSTNMRGGVLSVEEPAYRKVPPRTLEKKVLKDGDILVNKSSGSAHLVGASVLFRDPENGSEYLCSNFVRCLRPDSERVLSEYLHYAMRSPQFRSQAFPAQRTTSGLRNLKFAEFAACKIPLTTVDEQRRIVARIREALDRVDEVRQLRVESSAAASLLFESSLEEVFNPTWPSAKLGDIGAATQNGWSGKKANDGQEVGVLRLSAVHGMVINESDVRVVRIAERAANKFAVQEGDLFVVRGNGSKHLVGRPAMAASTPSDVVFNDLLIRVEPPDTLRTSFLMYWLVSRTGRQQIEERAKTAAGIWKINQKHIASLEVPLPPLSAQDDAVGICRELASSTKSLSRELTDAALEQIPQAILRKAFAGEL